MSYKQENLTDSGIVNKMKKCFSTKTIINSENAAFKSKTDEILKLISPAKSKFFMPKPRISTTHCKKECIVKSMVNICNSSVQQNMVITEPIILSTNTKQEPNEDTENLRLKKQATEEDLTNSNTCNLLAVTISCVMLMASNFPSISEEYLTWTEEYLSRIKDTNGEHPPNIQGILNHIKYIRIKQAEKLIIPNNKIKFSSRFSDIRSCNNSSCSQIRMKQYLEKKINSSPCDNRKCIFGINRTSSCATFAGISQSFLKRK